MVATAMPRLNRSRSHRSEDHGPARLAFRWLLCAAFVTALVAAAATVGTADSTSGAVPTSVVKAAYIQMSRVFVTVAVARAVTLIKRLTISRRSRMLCSPPRAHL